MRQWLGRRTTLIGLVFLVLLVSQVPFFRPVRDAVRQAVSGPSGFFSGIVGRLGDAFEVLFTVHDLATENTALREQLITQEAELAKLQYAQGENEQLKKDLEFRLSRPDFSLKPATVINYSPTNIYQAVTINLGSNDGLKTGQAVVANGFLIGKINQVSAETAEVWLLSNRNLLTPVMLSDSQTVGLLKGSIRGLVIENIPFDTNVIKGTPVITSALENLYPAGIAVGTVEEVISNKEEIFLTLRINTPINPSNLTTVYVVMI